MILNVGKINYYYKPGLEKDQTRNQAEPEIVYGQAFEVVVHQMMLNLTFVNILFLIFVNLKSVFEHRRSDSLMENIFRLIELILNFV